MSHAHPTLAPIAVILPAFNEEGAVGKHNECETSGVGSFTVRADSGIGIELESRVPTIGLTAPIASRASFTTRS